MTSLPVSSYLTPSIQSTRYYHKVHGLITQCINSDLCDDSIHNLITGIKSGSSLTENESCEPHCQHTVNVQILHKLLVPINNRRTIRGNSVIIQSKSNTLKLNDTSINHNNNNKHKHELLSDDDEIKQLTSDDNKLDPHRSNTHSPTDSHSDDLIDIIECIGFDILDDILPYLFHTNTTVQKYAHDLVELICKHCGCNEIFILFVAYLELNKSLQTSYILFPYIERLLQRTTNHRRADMLEQLFGVVMLIWRSMYEHEDEISVRFVVMLVDTMDSLTTSLSRLEHDSDAYKREQNILLTVVLRCAQWLLAEHWSTLVQASNHGQIQLKRYSSQEENHAVQKSYQQLLVERVPSIIRCIVHCGRLPVILESLVADNIVASFVEPNDSNNATPTHSQSSTPRHSVTVQHRPEFYRTKSIDYGNWSMPGIASVVALGLATNKFQDSMGHNNSGVRSTLLIAIDQSRCEYPSPALPYDRIALYLQCYPLFLVLLGDMQRHPAYLSLCIHLWNLLLNELHVGKLTEQYLHPVPDVHGRSVWLFIELCINCIVQMKAKKTVMEFVQILKHQISLFEPAAKYQLLSRALLNVPYSNVTALLLNELKDQLHTATVKRSGSQYNLKVAQQMSVYTSHEIGTLLQTLILRCQSDIHNHTDSLISALNIIKYIVLKQSTKPINKLLQPSYVPIRIIDDIQQYYMSTIDWIHSAAQQSINELHDDDDIDDSLLNQLQLIDNLSIELKQFCCETDQ